MIRFEYLAHHPEWIDRLAGWHFNQWNHIFPEWTLESVAADLSLHRDVNQIPITVVALERDEPIGSVSLIQEDLAGWEHLTPWLASLYVRDDCRRRGIGKSLVHWTVEEARRLGVDVLYLFTPGQQDFYAALGWNVFAKATAEGEPVIVMSIRIDAARPSIQS